MSRRIKVHSMPPNLEAIILFDSMWEDYVVRLFVNKKHQQDADYHTDCRVDADRTAKEMLAHYKIKAHEEN